MLKIKKIYKSTSNTKTKSKMLKGYYSCNRTDTTNCKKYNYKNIKHNNNNNYIIVDKHISKKS